MIRLRIVEGDLFDSPAKAILVPVDGALPRNAGLKLIERSLGRIGRELFLRSPELVEEIDSQVTFPIALGRAVEVDLPDRQAILVSMLPHRQDQTDDEALRAAAASGLAAALELCQSMSIPSLAMPLLKGGWRISTEIAASLMLKVLAASQCSLEVEIRVLDQGAALRLTELAKSLGL